MGVRITLAVWGLWAVCAMPAIAADTYYELNLTPYNRDLINADDIATTPDNVKIVNVAHSTYDNYVDLMIYEVDCAGNRLRLMSKTHFQNMTNGLHQMSADEKNGDWVARADAKNAKRYVDFVCKLPDSANHTRKLKGDTLAAAARTVALELDNDLRGQMTTGDDSGGAMMGKY